MNWSQPISEEIFKQKYMINGEEDAEEVFHGIAKEIASVEKRKHRKVWEKQFYDEISSGRLIPAGRILANARPNAKMPFYNNCYTIAVEDSIEGIYASLQEDAQISKTGGGVGINFSNLRPKDARLERGGTSSGAISFMKVFNESAKIIQTGGSRRAAHIGILNVDHPDIEEFITSKQGEQNNALTQFNISVGITDSFINAVDHDLPWDLTFEGKVYKTVWAKQLYDLMARNAFLHNEPGILNLDHINEFNNGYYAFKIHECNPCGEIIMPPYSLCCLSSINLSAFVREPFTHRAYFDIDLFRKTILIGIRFLDNVLDATEYPLQRIKDTSKQWRRIGLGFTGLADAWAMLGIVYGGEESKEHARMIGQNLRDFSYRASIELAKEKKPFSACDKKKLAEANFIQQLPYHLRRDIKKYGLRNIAMNTTAPTGTTSLSVGQNCSSGIEPIFSLQYDRSIRTGVGDEVRTETVMDAAWMNYLKIKETAHDVVADVPQAFVTTFDIGVHDAIDIQAIFQQYIDHSISKTLNLPTGTTYEEYKELFRYAYEKGLKGFTSFNPEGSMKGILEAPTGTKKPLIDRRSYNAPKRPKELPCDIHELTYKGDKYILLIGLSEERPYEMFVTKNVDKEFNFKKHKVGTIKKVKKSVYSLFLKNGESKCYIENIGDVFDPVYGSLSRFISMSLRHNVPLQFVVDQLIKDKNFMGFERVVSRVLKRYITEGETVKTSKCCPDCGNEELRYQEGCISCSCGWSKCS